jgi:hypothetical protein
MYIFTILYSAIVSSLIRMHMPIYVCYLTCFCVCVYTYGFENLQFFTSVFFINKINIIFFFLFIWNNFLALQPRVSADMFY